MHSRKILSICLLAAGLSLSMPAAVHATGTPPTEAPDTTAAGWQSDANGRFYLLPDGSKVKGLYTINNTLYCFQSNGYLLCPASADPVSLNNKLYFIQPDGSVKTGLFSVNTASGKRWYCTNSQGQLYTNTAVSMSGKVYCFGSDGKSMEKGLHKLNKKKYLIGSDGTARTGRQKYQGKVYFFGSDGAMLTGKVNYNGTLYYTKKDGTLRKKGWVTSNSKTYYVNSDGTLFTGWKKYRGKWYFMNRTTGVKQKNKWIRKSGKKCRLGKNGELLTKWYKVNGKKYYGTITGTDIGAVYTGVHQLGKRIYVFKSSGALEIGWTSYKGYKYYTDKNGEITRGWKTIKKKKYFFNDYGAMHTGWLYSQGNYYYMNPSTGAATTETKTIDGRTYTFSSSGVCGQPLGGSWTVKVNRQQNVVTVYKGGVPVRVMLCSTGVNNATPLGNFSIMDKLPTHELNGPTFGYYCSHITPSILFHSIPQESLGRKNLPAYKYNMLGSQASEGCIRLGMSDAYWLYNNVPRGSAVVVYESSYPGPLGKPVGIKIPSSQKYDPTDPLYYNTGK